MPIQRSLNPDPNYHEAALIYMDQAGNENAIIFDAVLSEDWNPSATVTEHPVEQGANIADHVRVQLMTCTLKVHVSNEPLTSNMFVDADQSILDIDVAGWDSGLDEAVNIGQFAGAISSVFGAAASQIEDATPLGNITAKLLRPVTVIGATGDSLTTYDVTGALNVGNYPVRNAGDLVSAEVFDAIQERAPEGAVTITPMSAQTTQFDGGFIDFASEMVNLLQNLMNQATLFTVLGSKQTEASMVITGCSYRRGATTETGTGAQIEVALKQVRVVTTQTVTAPAPSFPRADTRVNSGAKDPKDAPPAQQESVLDFIVDKFGNHI